MIFTKGDIFDVKTGIICQQVNCMGKMGSGLALAIRNKWPVVYQDYMKAYKNGQLVPGFVILSAVDHRNELYVANLCGQLHYGRKGRYTIYMAVEECLSKIAAFNKENLSVYIPYGMSCGLAGGDWSTVSDMISRILPNAIVVDNN